MAHNCLFRCGALSALLLSGVSSGALAQASVEESVDPVEVQTTPAQSPESDENVIIVTALKRSQSLEDVPVSISVVSAEQFQERGITTLSDLPTLVPGFEFVRAPAQTVGLTFRGLGPQAGNLAFDSSIGMFVDGVFLGNNRLFNQTLFDVERAEFIKGSQSALLGKNSTVGALSIVNASPSDIVEGRVEGGVEVEDGGYYVGGAISAPVTENVSVRLSGRYSYDKGYVRNIATDHTGPENTDWGFRAQLAYDNGTNFDANFRYQHTFNKQIGVATQCVEPGLAFPGIVGAPFGPDASVDDVCGDVLENDVMAAFSSDPRTDDGDDSYKTRAQIAAMTLNYDFGPVTLTSITAGVKSRTFNAADFDFDVKDFNLWVRDEKYHQFSQELRIASNDTAAAFQYILGAFYVRSNWKLIETRLWNIPDFPPVPIPGLPPAGQLFNGSWVDDFRQNNVTASVFGQLTVLPTDRLTINLAGRYSYDRKLVDFGREPDRSNLTLWNTVIQAPFQFQRLDPAVDNLLSGSISIQYEINDRLNIYTSAARSGKAGGYGEFAGIPADPTLPTVGGLLQGNPNRDARVKPERANAYELGLKGRLFDNVVTFDTALFWTDIFNLQQLAFTGQFIVTNDRVRNKGAEINFQIRPTDNLTFSGQATYAKVRDIRQNVDSVNAPRFSGSADIEYILPLASSDIEFKLRGGVRHRSSKFNQLNEQEFDEEFTTFNFGARVDSVNGWFANVTVENAFNAKGANFGFSRR